MILDAFRLHGQVALVTGVGSGLGQAMAVALAEAGADIAGAYRESYQETARHVAQAGRKFLPLCCDLAAAHPRDLGALVEQATTELGTVRTLINCAGTIRRAPALEFTEADWDTVMQVNLKAAFFLSQAVAQRLVAQPRPVNGWSRGKIINVASMLSFQGGLRTTSYTSSKTGIVGLTRALANEWASEGINVNAIAPGYFETRLNAPLLNDPARNQSISARIPAGRWGSPDDVKGAAVFLATAASDYVHGVTLPVDGGWLVR